MYNQAMPNTYTIQKDLQDRLDSTLIRYKGIPYKVRVKLDDDGNTVLFGYRMTNTRASKPDVRISPDDPDLDISMLEAMYINFKYGNEEYEHPQRACWLTRGTQKHYKSATYTQYMTLKDIQGSISSNYTPDQVFWNATTEANILGQYPSVEGQLEIMKAMRRTEYEVAVAQRVALKRETIGLIKIYIDTHIVGWIDPDTNQVKITNDDRRWAINRILKPLGFKL